MTSDNDQRVARIKLSNCYDVLNKYVLDTRVERYKEGEFYNYYMKGNRMSLRFVNVELPTGEIETLMTNLTKDELSTEDIYEIYKLRWGIETHYHELKESMMATNVSSNKDTIIKQEIYAQMIVYNIIRSITNEQEKGINQEKYKHPMKVNFNMAVGFVKRFLIRIMIEDDEIKRQELSNELFNNI